MLIAIMLWKEARLRGFFIRSDSAFALYCAAMISVCYLLGIFEENQFIYFQF